MCSAIKSSPWSHPHLVIGNMMPLANILFLGMWWRSLVGSSRPQIQTNSDLGRQQRHGQNRFASLVVDEPRDFALNHHGQMKPDNGELTCSRG